MFTKDSKLSYNTEVSNPLSGNIEFLLQLNLLSTAGYFALGYLSEKSIELDVTNPVMKTLLRIGTILVPAFISFGLDLLIRNQISLNDLPPALICATGMGIAHLRNLSKNS